VARTALITGASRGIGRASALELGRLGFDVAITARTVQEGEGRGEPTHSSDQSPRVILPGSLETTAAEVRREGRRVVSIRMDLLDRASVLRAAEDALREFGRVDVLVNNAISQRGTMDSFMESTPERLEELMRANFVHHVVLTQLLLPHMLDAGSGVIINVTSPVAHQDPIPGMEGAWGLGFAAAKGAFDRIAGMLHSEFSSRGIRAYNLDPGLVMTEAMRVRGREKFFAGKMFYAEPPVPGAVVGWLASAPEADALAGTTVHAQQLCAELGLVAGFALPDNPTIRTR
jgi:NAD(P)-dependent dehydrogenase (short-subunit alcohol dehydrogenase family)